MGNGVLWLLGTLEVGKENKLRNQTYVHILALFHFYRMLLILMHKVVLKMMCLALKKCSVLVPLPVYRMMTRGNRNLLKMTTIVSV